MSQESSGGARNAKQMPGRKSGQHLYFKALASKAGCFLSALPEIGPECRSAHREFPDVKKAITCARQQRQTDPDPRRTRARAARASRCSRGWSHMVVARPRAVVSSATVTRSHRVVPFRKRSLPSMSRRSASSADIAGSCAAMRYRAHSEERRRSSLPRR